MFDQFRQQVRVKSHNFSLNQIRNFDTRAFERRVYNKLIIFIDRSLKQIYVFFKEAGVRKEFHGI